MTDGNSTASSIGAPLILEARGLVRTFRAPGGMLDVLKGVDLSIREGEVVAIQGPSGVGKSTLLHIIGLLDRPTSGRLTFHFGSNESLDTASISRKQRAALRGNFTGFVFQSFHLLQDLDVLGNVLLPTMVNRSWFRFRVEHRELVDRARALLQSVGVIDRERHSPSTLSGGERQRVAIARALINRPRLLLCDEPTGNLDMETSERIHDLFVKLNQTLGTTFLIATHDMHLAGQAQRSLNMTDGRFDDEVSRSG